jgi:DNA polymerase I-like protein with 3'-5' exonuclease and polymerase domains
MTNELIHEAIRRCYRISSGLYGIDYRPKYFCPKTSEEVVACLEELLSTANFPIGLDIESNYVKEFGERMGDYWHPDWKCWCIGFSASDYEAFCIPFDPDPYLIEKFGLTSIYSCPNIFELVMEIMQLNCVTHSTSDALGLGVKYHLMFKDMDDSMLIQYAIDDTAGDLGLDDLARFHTEEGAYKKTEYSGHVAETIDQLDWDEFTSYCCHDTDIERRIYFILKEKAIEEDVWRGYTNVLKPSNMIGIKETLNGVAMNSEHLESLIQVEEDKKAPLVKEFYERKEIAECYRYIRNLVTTDPKHKQIKVLSDIKTSKDWTLAILLYDVCKYPCEKKTDKGARSVTAGELEKFKGKVKESERLVDLILEIKKIDKKLSTYLHPFVLPKIVDIEDLSKEEIERRCSTGDVDRYPYIKDDGLIHPRFHFHIARSGRSSSSDPNLQNVVSDILIKMSFVSRMWKNGRRGKLMLPDYAQAEVRMAAWLCRDDAMCKALELDFHTINQATQAKILSAKEVFSVGKDEIKKLKNKLYHLCLEELCKKDKYAFEYSSVSDLHYSDLMKTFVEDGDPKLKFLEGLWEEFYQKKRTIAKGSTFGPLFGQQPPAFAKLTGITLAEAEDVYATDRKLYPKKHAYFDEEKKKARKNNFVQSVFGKKRRLFYKFARTEGDINELDRAGINTLVQGPASDIGVLSMGKCMQTFEDLGISDKALGCGTIHDSLFFDYEDTLHDEMVAIVPAIMENYPEELLGPGPVKFKADIKYGDNWGELKKI